MIAGIVLAAGTSSRMGRTKQLLPLGGSPVLRHVVDAAVAAGLDEVIVVLGNDADRVARALPESGSVRTVVNDDFVTGQASSLLCGIRAASPRAEAAVVLLGDQPGIRTQAIEAVVGRWRSNHDPVVQASYGGRRAHPTLLDRSIWPSLESILGDQGARSLLERHPEWRISVEVGGDPPEDVDTEADYLRVRATFEAPEGDIPRP